MPSSAPAGLRGPHRPEFKLRGRGLDSPPPPGRRWAVHQAEGPRPGEEQLPGGCPHPPLDLPPDPGCAESGGLGTACGVGAHRHRDLPCVPLASSGVLAPEGTALWALGQRLSSPGPLLSRRPVSQGKTTPSCSAAGAFRGPRRPSAGPAGPPAPPTSKKDLSGSRGNGVAEACDADTQQPEV